MSKALATGDDLPAGLLKDVRALIEEARHQTAVAVNAGLTLLYWRLGQRIQTEVLGNERAAYGEQIVATLSRQLVAEYGRGFAEKVLAYTNGLDRQQFDASGLTCNATVRCWH